MTPEYPPMLRTFTTISSYPFHHTTISCSSAGRYLKGAYKAAQVVSLVTEVIAVLFQDQALPVHKSAFGFQLLLVAVE